MDSLKIQDLLELYFLILLCNMTNIWSKMVIIIQKIQQDAVT